MGYGEVFKLTKEDGMGIVTFDEKGEALNTWTEKATDEFRALLTDLEQATNLEGVIFISGKPENFHAGANLNAMDQMVDKESTLSVLKGFHDIFRRLGALKIPTLAAIEGHCLGGGLEFALACTARVAKESKTTLLGLPECNLGIFPGAGGTQRLPRLIGVGAMELILRGTIMPATKALELGIIDRLLPPAKNLHQEAIRFMKEIVSGEADLKRVDHDFTQIDQVAEIARQDALKATRGREIPGPMLAIKAIRDGVKVSLEEGLDIEMTYAVEVVLSREAKGSIHTFFLKAMSDKPRKMMSEGFNPKPLNKVAVLGFGTMGRGIVIDILRNTQIRVVAKDVPAVLEPGKAFVKKILDGMAEKKRLKAPVDDLMARFITVSDYTDEFKDVDLVIEAVFEDLKVKSRVYEELCRIIKDDCVIASNTSSIPISIMSKHVNYPERFGGAHFFSPVWLMQLVEIISGEKTSQGTIDNLLNFAASIRKRPIVCRDNPGFIVNAVLFPYFMDALDFIEAGNPIEKVDEAFAQFGMPIGPVKLLDEVGIDISHSVILGKGLEQDTLENLVAAGHLGLRKSGKGLFLKDGSVDPKAIPLISLKKKKEMGPEEMQMKVLADMVTVGKDLLDSGIVDDPRMIDIGMIWGTGFPAEKGGAMKWADLIGLSERLFGKTFYNT